MNIRYIFAIAMAIFASAGSAWACPYCDSDVGREVAAGIFNGEFAFNAVLTLLPIMVLMVIVAAIHFGTPWHECFSPSVRNKSTPSDTTVRSTTGVGDE
ncbi:hypothetical protein [Allorhodopirellula solitaria]|uniref:Uncharacterized protein n=1 Tax=Allorhodopirellula solitaria TaxID=2527987 RepID=A0A5C5WMZ6_9BACT|nr:hypothetical protein [Allorhodopirellula solitaria]TWT51555.1 hypothetical protein CA85_52480 [Allorhodopirellula solitaria]